MVDSFADLVLWSNVIGFGLSFAFNILYNLIQKKENRHRISFGSVMFMGIVLSIIAAIYFFLDGLGV